MKTNLITLIIFLALTLVSCKRETTPSTIKMLSKSWVIQSVAVNGNAIQETGTWAFNADNTYFITGTNSSSGSWALSQSEKELTLDAATLKARILIINSVSKQTIELEETIAATYKEGQKSKLYKLN